MADQHFEPANAFEGYVYAKLENIDKKFSDLPCGETFKRLNKVETDMANIKGKATALGAVAGFVAGLFKGMFMPK